MTDTVEKYKEMRRSFEVDGERSQEFLGQEPLASPRRRTSENKPHKWGVPQSPEQFRPDEWLGSPSSSKRRSYKIKNTNKPPIDLEEDEKEPPKSMTTEKKKSTIANSNNGMPDPSKYIPKDRMSPARASPKPPDPKKKVVDDDDDDDDDDGKPDPAHFFEIRRQSDAFLTDSNHRSQEFLGQAPPRSPYQKSILRDSDHSSTKSAGNQRHKWGTAVSPEQMRPIGWLGSPASANRRSYKIKNITDIMPAKLHQDEAAHDEDEKEAKSFVSPPSKTSQRSGYSAGRLSISMPILKAPPSIMTEDEKDELDAKSFVSELSKTSQRTSTSRKSWGGPSRTPASPRRESAVSLMSPRPPRSPKREKATLSPMYDKKGSRRDTVMGLPDAEKSPALDLEKVDRKKFVDAFSAFETEDIAPPRGFAAGSGKNIGYSQSTGTSSFNKGITDSPHSVMLSGEKSPARKGHRFSTPVLVGSTHSDAVVAPKLGVQRNFRISTDAKRKSEALHLQPFHAETCAAMDSELLDLPDIIASLRKVTIDDDSKKKKKEGGDKHDQQAFQIGEMMRRLKHVDRSSNKGDGKEDNALLGIMFNLRSTGVLDSKINRKELHELEDVIGQLGKVHVRLDDREHYYGEIGAVIQGLRIVTLTSGRQPETIEEAIYRLRKVAPKLHDHDKSETEDVISRLESIHSKITDREEEELAHVIRSLNKDDASQDSSKNSGVEELARVLRGLGSLSATSPHQKSLMAANLDSDDADFLASAIRRLKKVDMTKREAEACAEVVRNLRKVDSCDMSTESASDEDIGQLRQVMSMTRKSNEVIHVLKGLRRVDMTQEQTNHVADIIASLGKPSVTDRDEIRDVIDRLKKAKMSKWEAKEVAGIVFNLNKTSYDKHQNEKDSPKMVNLRKVMSKEKFAVVDDVIKTIKIITWGENEIFEFCDIIEGFGEDEPEPHFTVRGEIADAIERLKKVKMNKWEAKEVAGILSNLRKTNYTTHQDEKESPEMVNLRKVMPKEKFDEIEDVIKIFKRVTWGENEIFEFCDFIEGLGNEPASLLTESTPLVDVVHDGGHPQMVVNVPAVGDHENEGLGLGDNWDRGISQHRNKTANKGGTNDDPSIDTISFDEFTVETGSKKSSGEGKKKMKKKKSKPGETPEKPKPRFDFIGDRGGDTVDTVETEEEQFDEQGRKIIFNKKHQWKHKKHNFSIVSEKRWRKDEAFGADEVFFTPLSRDQHSRRKTVGEALIRSMGDQFESLDDMAMDGVENRHEQWLQVDKEKEEKRASMRASIL